MWILKSEANWLQIKCFCGDDGKWRCKEHNEIVLSRVERIQVHPKNKKERNSQIHEITTLFCPVCTPNARKLSFVDPEMSLEDDEIEEWRGRETFKFGTRVHIGKDPYVHGAVEDESHFPKLYVRDEKGTLHIVYYSDKDAVNLCDCD